MLLVINLGGARRLAGGLRKADAAGAGVQLTGVVAQTPAPTPAEAALARDRDVLVAACIEVCDTIASKALREQLLGALAQAGVTSVEVPANTRFDPAHHKAADTLATDQETLAGLVAETERPGFVDRGRRLRWPEVVVYQSNAGRSDGA